MRSLGIFGIVSLLLIVVLGVYSCTILQQFEEVEARIRRDYVAAAEALRALPSPETPAAFTAAKFEAWLETREALTQVMAEGLKDRKAITSLLVRRVRNDALESLATSLRERKMGFSEYCALQRRWRALVARGEQKTLRAAWDEKVRVASSPDPLALPEPAANITEFERKALKTHEARLIASLPADTLTVLLEKIEADEPLTEG